MREREKAIEAGRQVILRLLGEASTLKNQLAQIDEYLAGIERETARATREEQIAAAEIERLAKRAQAAFRSHVPPADGAGNGHRRTPPHRGGTGERRKPRRPNCAAQIDTLRTD